MQSRLPMHRSPRCGARTRRGSPCRSLAMPNGRCRLHGGLSPGAPSFGAYRDYTARGRHFAALGGFDPDTITAGELLAGLPARLENVERKPRRETRRTRMQRERETG